MKTKIELVFSSIYLENQLINKMYPFYFPETSRLEFKSFKLFKLNLEEKS